MATFQEKREDVSQARRRLRSAEERLRNTRSRAAAQTKDLQAAVRRGGAESERAVAIQQEIERLQARLAQNGVSFAEAKAVLSREILGLAEQDEPSRQIEEWDDRYPILLLPVRVEYRFMDGETGKELWVRIFPDDVATHTHESDLTGEEIEAGRAYWSEVALAAAEPDDDEREAKEKGAWHALTGDHGGARASWVMIQTRSDLSAGETLAGEAYWAERTAAEGEADADVREDTIAAAWLKL